MRRNHKTRPEPSQSHKQFILRNGNRDFYESTAREQIAGGPAGTGKTVAALLKLLTLADAYPGSRHLIVRKTRASLTESALVTFERDVLGYDNPIIADHPLQRGSRHSYKIPTGGRVSEIILAGLDNPGKTLSTEYDSIYVQEATEISLPEWEFLFRALRSPVMPWHCIFGDVNPTYPHHWLYQRIFKSDKIAYFPTTHKDNPRFYDESTGLFTNDGLEYLDTLKAMTGHRRKRFLEGVWAAAEGLVYDQYGEHNLLPREWKPDPSWTRYWSIDWGYTAPIVLQFWAVDKEKRAYLYREWYKTETLVSDLAKWAIGEVRSGREPRPSAIICDHDPANAKEFELHSGLRLHNADKMDRTGGIQKVQERTRLGRDLKPRIFYRKDCRSNKIDQKLVDAGKPASTIEEKASYVWDAETDRPVDENDHGMDAERYFITYLEDLAGRGNVW